MNVTDRHGRLIGSVELPGNPDDSNSVPDDTELPGVDPAINDDIEIPGVDAVEGFEDPDPREIEIDDLDIHEPDPPPIQVETVTEAEVPKEPPEPPVLQQVLPVLQPPHEIGHRRAQDMSLVCLEPNIRMLPHNWRAAVFSIPTLTCSHKVISISPSLMLWPWS